MNYYHTNFIMMQEYKYSLNELENMMPWERDVYVGLLMRYLEKKIQKNNS